MAVIAWAFLSIRAERDRAVPAAVVGQIDELGREADQLWPCGPENVAAIESWLARARR